LKNSTGYTNEHAEKKAAPPEIEAWPNQFPDRDYLIDIEIPEFTCRCPKTGQPDFATLQIKYVPDQLCLELKSLKLYLQTFRETGIFHENIVNQLRDDILVSAKPKNIQVIGKFNARGGILTEVRSGWPTTE
jgi:7-cyano-7-deazaguanine reductase